MKTTAQIIEEVEKYWESNTTTVFRRDLKEIIKETLKIQKEEFLKEVDKLDNWIGNYKEPLKTTKSYGLFILKIHEKLIKLKQGGLDDE